MSNFNLEKALNGEPFYMKNGYLGVIKYSLADRISTSGKPPLYPYIGYIMTDKGFIYSALACWNAEGKSNITTDYFAIHMAE